MNAHEKIALAAQAKQALDNTAYRAAVAAYRQDLRDKMELSEPGDDALRLQLHTELRCLRGIEDRLRKFMTDGAAATNNQNARINRA